MHELVLKLQSEFGERSFSNEELLTWLGDQGVEMSLQELLEKGWVEFADQEDRSERLHLSNWVLEQKKGKDRVVEDTLSLGDLEERIVGALEQGKEVPWGKLALAMWVFFIAMILYTLAQAYFD